MISQNKKLKWGDLKYKIEIQDRRRPELRRMEDYLFRMLMKVYLVFYDLFREIRIFFLGNKPKYWS